MSFTLKQANSKRLKIYTFATAFSVIFSIVYEYFSHQVYSAFMILIFMIPLIFGVIPEIVFKLRPSLNTESWTQKMTQAFGVAALAIGFCLQGIVEIYGTTNQYIVWYFVVRGGLILVSCVELIYRYRQAK